MSNEEFRPRPYQEYAIKKIIENPAVFLMLDMGMGKTVITLTAIQELLYNYFSIEKVLIVAPLHVAETTWLEENEKWEHLQLRIVPILGSERKRMLALDQAGDVYVINRENFQWLVNCYFSEFPFDMIVIDESSSFKNPNTKRFKAMRIARRRVKKIVELTGTPAPNSLINLWPQIYILDGGERLGTLTDFRRTYFTAGAVSAGVVYNWKVKPDAEKVIYKKISDVCIAMKSEDYLELPPMMCNVIKVPLSEEVKKSYAEFEKKMILPYAEDKLVATSAAVLTSKLCQFANGAVYNEEKGITEIHSAKLEALAEMKDLIESPMLVFYWFKHDLLRLQKKFPEAIVLKTRDQINAWNEGKIQMLLVHPESAGHGLNLQYGGNVIIWYSLTWSLELYQQANKRLHRIGQDKPVIIHHIVAQNTIDETIMKTLSMKKATQEDLLNALRVRINERLNTL